MKVNCKVKILSKKTLSELPQAWSQQDYVNILDLMGFSEEGSESEIREMAMMALADQEPEESAQLLLKYRLAEKLTDGQIQQLSHEMQEDKTSEEYPDIFLHHELFNINQLLFKSFNGRFPNCHAISATINLIIKPEALIKDDSQANEVLIKALLPVLGDHSAIARLYGEEVKGLKKFTDADGILWEKSIDAQEDGSYQIQLISSEYWLHDFPFSEEYETTFELLEPAKLTTNHQ